MLSKNEFFAARYNHYQSYVINDKTLFSSEFKIFFHGVHFNCPFMHYKFLSLLLSLSEIKRKGYFVGVMAL